MAQGEGFKHITVTAADDEDVVIVAGAVGQSGEESDAARTEDLAQTREEAPDPRPEAELQPEMHRASKSTASKDDSYRETTLEDLEQGPMPIAQRVVIVAAIVCIIGALIYYFAFMR